MLEQLFALLFQPAAALMAEASFMEVKCCCVCPARTDTNKGAAVSKLASNQLVL